MSQPVRGGACGSASWFVTERGMDFACVLKMVQSRAYWGSFVSSSPEGSGLESVERKLVAEFKFATHAPQAAPEDEPDAALRSWRAEWQLESCGRTMDRNVMRVFVVSQGRHVGVVYYNHADGVGLLLELDYF